MWFKINELSNIEGDLCYDCSNCEFTIILLYYSYLLIIIFKLIYYFKL